MGWTQPTPQGHTVLALPRTMAMHTTSLPPRLKRTLCVYNTSPCAVDTFFEEWTFASGRSSREHTLRSSDKGRWQSGNLQAWAFCCTAALGFLQLLWKSGFWETIKQSNLTKCWKLPGICELEPRGQRDFISFHLRFGSTQYILLLIVFSLKTKPTKYTKH